MSVFHGVKQLPHFADVAFLVLRTFEEVAGFLVVVLDFLISSFKDEDWLFVCLGGAVRPILFVHLERQLSIVTSMYYNQLVVLGEPDL